MRHKEKVLQAGTDSTSQHHGWGSPCFTSPAFCFSTQRKAQQHFHIACAGGFAGIGVRGKCETCPHFIYASNASMGLQNPTGTNISQFIPCCGSGVNHHRRNLEWCGLNGTLKIIQFQSPAMGWLPPTSSGCPGPQPWPWAPPGMGHPHFSGHPEYGV